MSNGRYYAEPTMETGSAGPRRKCWKVRLRNYLNKRIEKDIEKEENRNVDKIATIGYHEFHHTFAKSFEGWNIRLHKAVNGHIVEAWKSNDDRAVPNNYRPIHEMFMVRDDEDMGEALNSILVQLMLRSE